MKRLMTQTERAGVFALAGVRVACETFAPEGVALDRLLPGSLAMVLAVGISAAARSGYGDARDLTRDRARLEAAAAALAPHPGAIGPGRQDRGGLLALNP